MTPKTLWSLAMAANMHTELRDQGSVDFLKSFKSSTVAGTWSVRRLRLTDAQRQLEKEAAKTDWCEEVSSLATRYEKNRNRQRFLGESNGFITWFAKRTDDAKTVITHPRRLRWAAMDQKAFEALLEDIHHMIDRIHGLLRDYDIRQIQEIHDWAGKADAAAHRD